MASNTDCANCTACSTRTKVMDMYERDCPADEVSAFIDGALGAAAAIAAFNVEEGCEEQEFQVMMGNMRILYDNALETRMAQEAQGGTIQ